MECLRVCVSVMLLVVCVSVSHCHSSRIKMIATPVVYTNGKGGGADELEVPAHSEASRLFDAGAPVLSTWWVPYDNIGDLPAMHNIHTVPAGNSVHLKVHGKGHQHGARTRIMIYAELADNYA